MKQNGTSWALTNAALLSCKGLTERKRENSLVEGSKTPSPVKTRTSLGLPPKEVAKESQLTCFFCNESEIIFLELQLLHLTVRSGQWLQNCKDESS